MNINKILIGTIALAGLSGMAQAQITNSAHDFSSYSWSGGEICKPCHTPHFGNMAAGMLWNHTLSTANYTLFGGSAGTQADIDRGSRLCLSCHDGTVALDSFGGKTGTNFIPGGAKIGTDLSDDHPIGKEAVYPTTTSTRFNPQTADHKVTSTWGSLRLRDWVDSAGVTQYVVGCRTCHNVHNAGNFDHMLNFSNASSHLCLTCHIK
jgi:hypothetical protein